MCTLTTYAQSEEENVKKTIIQLFEGMRRSDSTLIKAAVAPGAILQTVAKNKEGQNVVRTEAMSGFITAVTQPREAIQDERITFGIINIDGDLAAVWTPYRFYVGEQFSHCGVNSFQLVRLNGEWKIQYIIDTRRKDNCPG